MVILTTLLFDDIKGGSVYNTLVQTCIYDHVDVLSGMNMDFGIRTLVLANNSGN